MDYHELVQRDRIHGSLYWDRDVFEDELNRIWYGQWVYIGHESEVPAPGDYVRKQLGLQPVILTRDAEGAVHVLYNRCAHLGNLVCHEPHGNAATFQCPFHGWSYAPDGRNVGVPFIGGYGPGFDKAEHPLRAPARTASYRGFVFASGSAEVAELTDYLGHAARYLDDLCDLSPAGELELTAGWIRHKTLANWKLGYEAALDGYHPRFVHRGLISLIPDSNFHQADDRCPARIRSLGNGHGDVYWAPHYRARGRPLGWLNSSPEKVPGYVRDLEAARGPERAAELLMDGPPHIMICPNLFVAELFIMVLDPISPTAHVQTETPILWKGAEELNQRNLRQTGASIGPAGMVLADDAAMAERNQRGFEAREPEWLVRDRGSHRGELDAQGIRSGCLTDDAGIMGFWEHYRAVMTAGATAS